MQAGDPRARPRASSARRLRPARSTRPRRSPTWLKATSRPAKKCRAKREAIAAMEVAPGYPRAQDLLLKLVP